MPARIPELSKKAGVAYAVTRDGIELPVIDVTHPAFRIPRSAASIPEQRALYARDEALRWRGPALVRWYLFRRAVRQSVLLRGLRQASGSFLSGLNTYLLKLGPDNLGLGYAGPLDRRIATSPPATDIRLRLEATAQLLAGGLVANLAARPRVPLHLVNIAGGPAADSLNALILLQHTDPALLRDRPVRVHVLDLEAEAPEFGGRALAALQAEGFPLHGIDAAVTHHPYNWSDPAGLRRLLAELGGAVVAVSTEGGLFEYGSDDEIRVNLAAIRETAPPGTFVVGSVTTALASGRRTHSFTRIQIRPRTLAEFRALSAPGWEVEQAVERILCLVVRLRAT
jgi:hypothetical protein